MGDPAAPTAGDMVIINDLQVLGYSPVLVDDDATVTASAETTLVVIGPSSSGTAISDKYESLTRPVLMFASTAWDSMGLTETDGTVANSTSLDWVDAAQGISTNLPSPVQVVPTAQQMQSMSAANLADGATRIAVRSNNTAANVVFVVDQGAQLSTTGLAPARRGVVGFTDAALTQLNADGQLLVQNVATWTTEGAEAFKSVTLANPCPSTLAAIVCYKMEDTSNPPVLTDSRGPQTNLPWEFGKGVSRVQRAGQNEEYKFTGWTGKLTGGRLDNSQSIAADRSQLKVDDSAIQSGETLNPGLSNFELKVRLKPTYRADLQLPEPSTPPANPSNLEPSYNIVQKGRSTGDGGFYKLELMGYEGGGQIHKGTFHCSVQDSDGTTADAYADGPTGTQASSEAYFTVSCIRSGKSVRIEVLKDENLWNLADGSYHGGTEGGLQDVSPTNTGTMGASAFGRFFTIGKKPDSTVLGDSFAGSIDYVVLAALPPS